MTAALPPTTLDAARDEITRLRAQLSEYVGHEPTIREEMAYAWSLADQLEAERDQARRIAVALEQENARLHQVVAFLLTNPLQRMYMRVFTSDIDAMAGRVDITDLGGDRTEITYRWLGDILAEPAAAERPL